jgi:uncharacterized protein YjbI with pentapeptide repeats
MRRAVFNYHFEDSDFLGADLTDANFKAIDAAYARFAVSTLQGATFHGGIFNNADFQGADLRRAITERGYIGAGTTTYGAGGIEYAFVPDHPQWPILLGKDLSVTESLKLIGRAVDESIDRYGVDFSNARFLYADLRGAHLENSNISQKQVNEACADSSTVLPTGVRVITTENCSFPNWLVEVQKSLRSPTYKSVSREAICKSVLGER